MLREEIIEALHRIYEELDMSVEKYVDYANKRYNEQLVSDTALVFRTGAVKTQVKAILDALDNQNEVE